MIVNAQNELCVKVSNSGLCIPEAMFADFIQWNTGDEMEQQSDNDAIVEPITRETVPYTGHLTGKFIAAYVSWHINDSNEPITSDDIAHIVSGLAGTPTATATFDHVRDELVKRYRFKMVNDRMLRRLV